jgi:hypothetical protein
MTAFDGDLEGKQVGFARRRRIDARIERAAIRLLVVEGEMLDGRQDMPALRAGDRCARHDAREQRVFGKIFEIAAAARVANEVDGAAEQQVEATGARLVRHRLTLAARQRLVPSRGERQIRRHRRRTFAAADVAGIGDAEFAVGLLQSRHAEPWRPRDEAGRADRAVRLGSAAPRRAKTPVHQRKLLGFGHPRQRLRGALGGSQSAVIRWRGGERRRGESRKNPQRSP